MSARLEPSRIRNIAIIAHVDHGKTTLVDKMLGQSGTFLRGEGTEERAMDSNDLEKERGITILSKCTSITLDEFHVNIVDTPGHADFGGEVERVMRMVDSVLLLVDATDGPMPQTRFVTKKALERGIKPIVVINKIDRDSADPDAAVNAVFDLFVNLNATDEQLDFPIVYASAKQGYAVLSLTDERKDLRPLFDTIIDRVPPPSVNLNDTPALQVTTFSHDEFLGSLAIGRIDSGRFRRGDNLLLARRDGSMVRFRASKIFGFKGLNRDEVEEAVAGDIIGMTGMEDLQVGETITTPENPRILPLLEIDAPTVTMNFMVNTSPGGGTEGRFVTSRNLRERLERELRSNVSLRIQWTDSPDIFEVSGRGELHLSVLIETMRREGYELMVSQPRVITREDAEGNVTEPYELVVCDIETGNNGIVMEELNRRGGRMLDMRDGGPGRTRLEFIVPTRGLIGYRTQFMTETRGTGVLTHVFQEYGPWAGPMRGRANGVLIVQDPGEAVTYGMWKLQDRGIFFIHPNVKVYGGQIIGLHNRDNDLIINPGKAKKLTNIRTHAADEKNVLTPPKIMTLEEAIEFINEDELVEVTPKSIRLRKRILDHSERRKYDKSAAAAIADED
jgi:GTP-binding protein